MKDHLHALRKASAAFFILCVCGLPLLAQGPLPPPAGPIGPTMKSLDQIDAHVAQAGDKRIPVTAATTPGDSNHEFRIKQPGSYYLSDNLSTSKVTAISVETAGVTIDLNGFQIKGTGFGIYVAGDECIIRNGTITGFSNGVFSPAFQGGTMAGIVIYDCSSGAIQVGDNWQIVDCIAHNNGAGISIQKNGTVKKCKASNNQRTGIFIGDNSIAIDCTAFGNRVGIEAGSYCGVFHCAASGNTTPFSLASGIIAGNGSTVADCVASSNATSASVTDGSSGGGVQVFDGSTIKNCTVDYNAGHGIQAAGGCTISGSTANNNGNGTSGAAGIATDIRANISGCTAIGNKADGILFSGDSFVLNNHASKNGGAGFHDLGSASRIDGNVSRENVGTGILASTGDTVVRNNSGANGNGAANNQYGPTAGANWGPVGTANSTTSPWANF
jgi:hypothetical protein